MKIQIKGTYLLVFALANEIAQVILNYTLHISVVTPLYVGHIISIMAGIAAFFPSYSEYKQKYQAYKLSSGLRPYIVLIVVAILLNSMASGKAAVIFKGEIVRWIISAFPWMAIHSFVTMCVVIMILVAIHKISSVEIEQSIMIRVAVVSALITAVVFTPAGTVGWVIREQSSNAISSFVLKNLVVIPAMSLVVALIVHLILVALSAKITSSILNGLEVLLATVVLFAISTGFVSIIGNFGEQDKSVTLILSFLQFYLFFLSVFKIAFYAVNVAPITLLSANRDRTPHHR